MSRPRGSVELQARSPATDSPEGTTENEARRARPQWLQPQRRHYPPARMGCGGHRRSGAPGEAAPRHPLFRRAHPMPTAARLRSGRRPRSAGQRPDSREATERLGRCACHFPIRPGSARTITPQPITSIAISTRLGTADASASNACTCSSTGSRPVAVRARSAAR